MKRRTHQAFPGRRAALALCAFCLCTAAPAFVFLLGNRPPVLRVADFGAVPNDGADDAAAFRNALDALVAAGGGILAVPPGSFDFASLQTIDLAGTLVEVQGCGKGLTRLNGNNAAGIWRFANTGPASRLAIRDLTFVANAGGSAGTALQVENESLDPHPARCSLWMERIGFEATASGIDYFYRHIDARHLSQPVFIDVFVPSVGMKAYSDSGFRIDRGHGARFENCYSKGNSRGWRLSDYQGTVVFDRCNPVGNDVGILVEAMPGGPALEVDVLGVHANTSQCNVQIAGAARVAIENLASYVNNIQTPFTDFLLQDCTNVVIRGCTFHQPYNPYRTMVHLAGTTRDVVVKHNIFNGKYWGTGPSEVVNVLQDPGVSNVSLVDNLDPPSHQW